MLKLLEPETKAKVSNAIKIVKILFTTIIIIGVFIIAFIGVYFPKKSKAVIKAENSYFKIDDERKTADANLKICLSEYNKGQITKNYLDSELTYQIPLILKLEKESEVLKKKYKKSLRLDKVFGFRNIKIFFGHLGMPVTTVFLGLYLLILFLKEEDFFWRRITLAFSISGLITGLFYVTWVFYPKPDLPQNLYILLLFSLAILGTIIAFIIGKYFYALSQIDLKLKIQNLLSFITLDVKKKYINKLPKQDHKEYINDYLGEIKKLSQK